jgi:hypothetical protein
VPDEPEPVCCPVCGNDLEYVDCWRCGGEGYDGHECGEDCCACAEPEDNVLCEECGGGGGYLECPALPHPKEEHRVPQ